MAGKLHKITRMSRQWSDGICAALEELCRSSTRNCVNRRAIYFAPGERPGHTLQTTALIHEKKPDLKSILNGKKRKSGKAGRILTALPPIHAAHLVDHAASGIAPNAASNENLPLEEAHLLSARKKPSI